MTATTDINFLIALAVLGVILTIPHLLRILDFIWFYFLRPSSVKRHLHGKAPYAIVTGATAGIGKATAAELLARGFNVILHGRNEAKMRKVINELRSTAKGKSASAPDIRYFIADASKGEHDWARLLEPFRDLQVTVVVHNVTGGDLINMRIDERTEESLLGIAHATAHFALFLTRALLPQLRRAAQSGPVQVLFMGSIAAESPPLFLPVYAASKAFLKTLAHALDNDELLFGTPTGVCFTHVTVGVVNSANHAAPTAADLWVPTSAAYARSVVESIGCGRRTMTPYIFHAIQHWWLQLWGDRVMDKINARYVQEVLEETAKKK